MRETKPSFGITFGFALFCQVLVLFVLDLNGFCLSFGGKKRKKTWEKQIKGKSLRNTDNKPIKQKNA